jgi:hypothetical protein
MRTRDSIHRKNSPFYGPERFTYQPESNSYRCPAGEQLNYVGLNVRNRAHAYIGSGKRCGACSQKAQCTSGRYKYLAIHMDEAARCGSVRTKGPSVFDNTIARTIGVGAILR